MENNRRPRRVGRLPNKAGPAPTPAPAAAPKTKTPDAARRKAELERMQLENERLRIENEISKIELEQLKREEAEASADPTNNHVYELWGRVTSASMKVCIDTLRTWSMRSPGCDITLILNSPGGYVIHGLALYDHLIALRHMGHEITIVVLGHAASMGGILLQAASEGRRFIGANAYMLIHEMYAGGPGKTSERERVLKWDKKYEGRLIAILAKRSTLTATEIRARWKDKEWCLLARETVELGFADKIWRGSPAPGASSTPRRKKR